jgi:large subunit ribosomal protein L21
MYAVIKTGGKQYRVATQDKITIEKLEGEAGDQVQFTDGDSIDVGAPLVTGATVVGEIAAQEKSATVYIFKKRRRKHYRRRNGHRQLLTSVTITEILTGGAKPAAKAKAAKPASAEAQTVVSSDAGKSAKVPKAAKKDAPAGDTEAGTEKKAAKSAKQASPDDLTLIGGVGPKIGKVLHELGYTTFAQVAAWTDADIEKVEEMAGPKGRISREEWIEQAKELMAGKPPRAKADRERE